MVLYFSVLISTGYALAEENHPNILVLNSYHQGENWTDNETAGIFGELLTQYPTLVPLVETLDTKRYPSPAHLDFLRDYLLRKYHDRRIDLIIALDNPALNLIAQNPTELFPDVPVVFAGINGFRPEMIADRRKVTGVIERQDVAGTLKMALAMHPKVSRVLAVHDYTASGLAVRQETETALAQFAGQLKISYSADVSFETLSEELKEMPDNGLVLILTYVTDKAGHTFTREESTRLISSLSPAPVYAMHETRLGFGIMGGLLLEGKEHGRQAARLAFRVLQGEDPDRIAVEESHSRSILDFQGLRRFKIPEDLWPRDALVVNRPISFWNLHKNVLIPSIAAIIVLLGLSSLLLGAVVRLRHAKKTIHKSEEKYRVLFNSFPLGITVADQKGEIVETNAMATNILSVPKKEHEGRKIDGVEWRIIRPDGTPMPIGEYASTRALQEKRLVENIEMGVVKPDAGVTWLSVTAAPLNLENFGVVVTYLDVTASREAEEALRVSEAVHSKMVANIGDVIVIIDRNGINRYKSPNIEKWFGWKPDDVVGFNAWDNVHPDDLEKGQTFIGTLALTPNATGTTEVRYRCKDGSYKWIEVTIVNLLHDTLINGFLGNYHDINNRKQTENSLNLIAESSLLSAQDIFPFLVRQIAVSQGMRYALIARVDHSDFTAHTVVVWCGERYGENFSYALEGTPCNNVVSGGDCFYSSNVQALFPHDQLLVDMGIESYWGTALRNSTGEILGVMAIMHDQPIIETPQTHALLQTFALRTSIEMERQQTEKFLRENQEDLKEAQHVAKLGNWRLNIKNNQVVWSDELYKMYGFDPALPPPPYTEHMKLFTPESWERLSTALQHTRDTGIPYDLELETLRLDGSHGWMWAHGMAEVDATKEIIGLRGVAQDITERKQAEEKLVESEKLLSQAQKIAQTGSWKLDLTESRLTWSDETYRIFGYEQREFAASYEAFLEAVHPDERVMVNEAYSRSVLEGSDGYEFEHRIVQRNSGKVRHVYERCVHERDDAGTVMRSTGMVQDITERKQSEEALRESEARFKALHNASFGGIAIHDNGIILECNQGLSEISGYSNDELIGMNGLLLISEKSRDMVLQNILDGYEKPYETIGLQKNNEEYPLRLEGRNIPYKGKIVRVVEFRDITEQKRQEEEKNQLEHKLRQSQKMEAVGQLAGGVAHDFNNMLGVIIGYSELILEQVDPSQQFHAELEEIQKAARRSADLTRQLLTFARKQTVAPQVLNLNQAIEGMFNMLRRLIGENIDLIWMPGSGLWQINMDPSQIDQILANLCVNARDAIAGVGKLTVETKNVTFDKEYCATHAGSLPGEYVRIAVSDTGSGMDKETLAHIFEPFFTTKGVGEGTGLGLATVYGAVKQNNGFINAYSEPGQGTTFTIYLPRYVEETTQTQTTESAKPVLRGDEIIMLVEDEPTLLEMTKTMLERLGYTILAAGTPSDAIRLAGEYSGQIHLLATDVIMPEMNGRELAERLGTSRPEMKCLFMSGYTANIIANQGVLKEGVAFIQKPFSKNELAAKVREALES
jgi:PAS domain S-box-containing protein